MLRKGWKDRAFEGRKNGVIYLGRRSLWDPEKEGVCNSTSQQCSSTTASPWRQKGIWDVCLSQIILVFLNSIIVCSVLGRSSKDNSALTYTYQKERLNSNHSKTEITFGNCFPKCNRMPILIINNSTQQTNSKSYYGYIWQLIHLKCSPGIHIIWYWEFLWPQHAIDSNNCKKFLATVITSFLYH